MYNSLSIHVKDWTKDTFTAHSLLLLFCASFMPRLANTGDKLNIAELRSVFEKSLFLQCLMTNPLKTTIFEILFLCLVSNHLPQFRNWSITVPVKSYFKVELRFSHHSSMGSTAACYWGGPGFKSRQGR